MKVSVIICTYNDAHLLPDALRTLAAQTFREFELLIVDDGSTDNTEEVVRRFSHQFRKCVYLQKPHTGLADSRNFGIRAASGTHIAFLDADDLWSPNYIEVLRSVFQETPEAELICSNGLCVNDCGLVLGSMYPSGLPGLRGRISTARELFGFFPYSRPSATVFLKSLFERVGPYDMRFPVGHDQHWVIRAASNGAFCVRLDEKLILYRQHGACMTMTQPVGKLFEEWLLIFRDVLRGSDLDQEIESYSRALTRTWLPPLLTRGRGAQNRKLLRLAKEAQGMDWILEACYFLTYFGLCPLAKWARQAKHLFRRLAPKGRAIDLNAPSEVMFATVPGESQTPSGMTAGKST